MSESARDYGCGPGPILGRAAKEPKTKVQLALALGRAEERVQTLETQVALATMERRQASQTIRVVEEILEGAYLPTLGPPPTRAHGLAIKVIDDAADAKRASEAFAKHLAVIAEALDRGATLAKVGPGEGYVCERGLMRGTGSTPTAAAEAFLKADAAARPEEAKPQ